MQKASTKTAVRRQSGPARIVNPASKKAAVRRQIEKLEKTTATVLGATRRDLGLSQEDLAELLGWSRDTVAALETNRRKTSLAEAAVIAQKMGADPEQTIKRILQW